MVMTAILFVMLISANYSEALPVVNQTGNLIQNGNFETGERSAWRLNSDATVTVTGTYTIDGNFSTFIDTTTAGLDSLGHWSAGLWQFDDNDLVIGSDYTVSAWIYPIAGQAQLGFQWDTWPVFSNPTTNLNSWKYVEVSGTTFSLWGGALLYGLSNHDKFYVDGVWMNQGHISLSPYAPQNGFPDPNPASVPEPSTLLLLGTGLAGVGIIIMIMRRKQRK